MNNFRQRQNNVLLNFEFHNVDEPGNNVVKMSIFKENNKNPFKLNAKNSKFSQLFHNLLHFGKISQEMHRKNLS